MHAIEVFLCPDVHRIAHQASAFGGATLTPRVDYNYEAKRSPAVSNAATTPSSKIVNARLAWTSAERDWELALAVNNATDEYYFYNIFDISTFGGWTAGQPAPPREWAFTVRRNF